MISRKTLSMIVDQMNGWAMNRGISADDLDKLLERLVKIPGNKSFTDSMRLIQEELAKCEPW